jgi:hypothetical protein
MHYVLYTFTDSFRAALFEELIAQYIAKSKLIIIPLVARRATHKVLANFFPLSKRKLIVNKQ